MIIIGVDFHPEFQQMASVDTDTGEFVEKRLAHREEAETFYRGLAAAGQKQGDAAKQADKAAAEKVEAGKTEQESVTSTQKPEVNAGR